MSSKYLLDTHVVLWLTSEPERIREAVIAELGDTENTLWVSAVSAWEIAIKQSLKKLELPAAAEDWLPKAVAGIGADWLPILPEDALAVRALPYHHRDPFDRMLIAQSTGGRILVTHDDRLREYGVPVMWT